MKMSKENSLDIEFWAAQFVWFIIMSIIAVAVVSYWWCWGIQWIEAGGTHVIPLTVLAIITGELCAIVYFKISVPEDDGSK